MWRLKLKEEEVLDSSTKALVVPVAFLIVAGVFILAAVLAPQGSYSSKRSDVVYTVEVRLNKEIEEDGELTNILLKELTDDEFRKFRYNVEYEAKSSFELVGKVYNKSIFESYRIID